MKRMQDKLEKLRITGLRKRGRPRKVYPSPPPPPKCYEWWIKFEAFGFDETGRECAVASVNRPYEPIAIVGQAVRFDRAVRGAWPEWLPPQRPIYHTSVYRKEASDKEQMMTETGIPMTVLPKPLALDFQI